MALLHIPSVSGEAAECAQREQAVEPRPLTPRCLPVGPGAPQGAAAGQDASDIAGIGKALDRGGQNLDYDPARADREGGSVIHEGGRNFKSEGLHFGPLVIM
jgi:hypothetical protein